MLGGASKTPLGTCLGSNSTKPLIPKYNPLEGSSKTEAKGISETMGCWALHLVYQGKHTGFKQ